MHITPALMHCRLAIIAGCLVELFSHVACSNEPGQGPEAATPGLHIIQTGPREDTVFARPVMPLIVEYRASDRQPRSGVAVRFETVPDSAPDHVLFLVPPLGQVSRIREDTTDEVGRAAVSLVFTSNAGTTPVRVIAPALGLSDSTSYTVRPGTAVRMALAPADTALYAGASAQLRAYELDRWGNQTPQTASWSTPAGVVTVSSSGRVTGHAVGRAIILATLNAFKDSLGVSVVPPGVIAADSAPIVSGQARRLVVFSTDGSNFQTFDLGPGASCGAVGLSWAPDGSRVAYAGATGLSTCYERRLFVTDLNGAAVRVRPDTAPLSGESWPAYSPDGAWIYFTGRPGHQNGEVWRVHPDGTASERVGSPAGFYDLDAQPSPSPDGAKILFESNRGLTTDLPTLRLLDLIDGSVTDLGVAGTAPSWSPAGDLIAYQSQGQYYVAQADGSQARSLGPARSSGDDRPSWSPDGRWLVVAAWDSAGYAPVYGRLVLIEVESGLRLPLGWTKQMDHPSWRPRL